MQAPRWVHAPVAHITSRPIVKIIGTTINQGEIHTICKKYANNADSVSHLRVGDVKQDPEGSTVILIQTTPSTSWTR